MEKAMSHSVFVSVSRMGFLLAVATTLFLASHASGRQVSWSQRMVSGPSARASHSMAFDSYRQVAVLFGGATGPTTYNGETWEWNGSTWALRPATGPSPRYGQAMAYDSVRRVTVLFGGQLGDNGLDSDETWEWDGTIWARRFVAGPSAREFARMAFDSIRGVCVLFGGWNPDGTVNPETWEYNGTTWSQRSVSGPAARADHAMTFDSARGLTVLFGGQINRSTGNGVHIADAETWEWNGTVWTKRVAPGPAATQSHVLGYDHSRGVSILFGGLRNDNSISGETWEWDGTAWVYRSISGPSPRRALATAYDSTRQAIVLFGGYNGSHGFEETWELAGPCVPAIGMQPTPQRACFGGSASFYVGASSSSGVAYAWRRQQVPINPLANPSAATPTLNIAQASWADALSYDCVVTNSCGSVTSDAATLTVCAADFDCDGTVDFFDYDAFVMCFEGDACPPGKTADFDGDDSVDFFDYDAFVVAFETAC